MMILFLFLVLFVGWLMITYLKRRFTGVAPYHNLSTSRGTNFEGWYFKLVADNDPSSTLVVIPGIYNNSFTSEHFSFIQIYRPSVHSFLYLKFSTKEFVSNSSTTFDISIGNKNHFTLSCISLDLSGTDSRGIQIALKGSISNGVLNPWKSDWKNFNVMGPLGFLPFLETSHGILSFTHTLNGKMQWIENEGKNENLLCFNGGKGYIEKDWGCNFPSSYIWAQSNHFANNNSMSKASLVLAIAKMPIPFPILHQITMKGFFCGLTTDAGDFYSFATYKYSNCLEIVQATSENGVTVKITSEDYSLCVEAFMPYDINELPLLAMPTIHGMERNLKESLSSEMHVSLQNKKTGKMIFQGNCTNSGLEIHNPNPLNTN